MRWLILLGIFGLSVQRCVKVGDVLRRLNRERRGLGMVSLIREKKLDVVIKQVTFFRNFPLDSPLSLDKQSSQALFGSAVCDLFKEGCGELNAKDFVKKIGLKIVTTKSTTLEEVVETLKVKDQVLSRGKFGCEPLSYVAGDDSNGRLHMGLFPTHAFKTIPSDFGPFRSVDFCPSNPLIGMEGYWVPDTYKKFRELYNKINLNRTSEKLPPFKFSETLSIKGSSLKNDDLLCGNTSEVSCMPRKSGKSHQTFKYSAPIDSSLEYKLDYLYDSLSNEPILVNNSLPARKRWYTIGFTESETDLTFWISTIQKMDSALASSSLDSGPNLQPEELGPLKLTFETAKPLDTRVFKKAIPKLCRKK